jgi:glycosyltransferase involved in cell wall biosynthesis
MSRPLRLLTIGHSYVVGANRRLAHEMAVAGAGEWEVTAVAPERYPGDLRMVALEPVAGERCRVEAVPLHLAGRVHVMRYGRRLREIMREGWDVVHCWEEPYVLAASQVASLAPPSAALVFATFQNLPKRYPWPFSRLERRAMRRADGWIAFGKTVEEALRERPGYRDLPRRVVPPGVDVERFRPDPEARRRVRESLQWKDVGPPVVGFLGRFVPEKGLETLMDALEECRRPWRALLVGGGPLKDDAVTFRAAQMDRVRVVTGVPHDQVPAYLNAMDLLCAPSETTPRWREQFGRMLVEAMACGVPVIGSDSGEIPHVIGDAGVVVPERDPEALSRAIDALAGDPERRVELSRRGLERARAEFALPSVARRHLDFFAEVLARKRAER